MWPPPLISLSAGGRNRTDMDLRPGDFESPASTSFTTPAFIEKIMAKKICIVNIFAQKKT